MKKFVGILAMCAALGACDKTAKNGDTVIIDFAGFLGEEQFAGGTAENFPLKLGSGQFVPGFEDQLIGANITFPQDYVPNLAGKDVVFKVTIKEIQK